MLSKGLQCSGRKTRRDFAVKRLFGDKTAEWLTAKNAGLHIEFLIMQVFQDESPCCEEDLVFKNSSSMTFYNYREPG